MACSGDACNSKGALFAFFFHCYVTLAYTCTHMQMFTYPLNEPSDKPERLLTGFTRICRSVYVASRRLRCARVKKAERQTEPKHGAFSEFIVQSLEREKNCCRAIVISCRADDLIVRNKSITASIFARGISCPFVLGGIMTAPYRRQTSCCPSGLSPFFQEVINTASPIYHLQLMHSTGPLHSVLQLVREKATVTKYVWSDSHLLRTNH